MHFQATYLLATSRSASERTDLFSDFLSACHDLEQSYVLHSTEGLFIVNFLFKKCNTENFVFLLDRKA